MTEHPTIPQIVQALVTLNDRHQADMKKIRADHVERVRRLQEGTEPMPPMDHQWDRYDIEYAEYITDEDGDSYFVNKYKKVENRDDALSVARELLANKNVAGIHFLYQKHGTTTQWDREGHPQTDIVAKAQNDAFKARKELKALGEQYNELSQDHERTRQAWNADVESLNLRLAARDTVIEELLTRIRAVYAQLRRDNNNCSYSEPLDIMNLLVGVGQQPDERWYAKLFRTATEDEKRKAKERKSRELGERTGLESRDSAVECDCGMTWPDGKMGQGHGDRYCRAQVTQCPTRFDGGAQCAGTTGHASDCTPNADDIPTE
jgi:hypothetical protein